MSACAIGLLVLFVQQLACVAVQHQHRMPETIPPFKAAVQSVSKIFSKHSKKKVTDGTALSAEPAEADVALSFELLPSSNCVGHDVNHTLDVNSVEECAAACGENPKCAAYVWCFADDCHFGVNTCWMKDESVLDCLRKEQGAHDGRDAGIVLRSKSVTKNATEEALAAANIDQNVSIAASQYNCPECINASDYSDEEQNELVETNRTMFESLESSSCPGHDVLDKGINVETLEGCRNLCATVDDCSAFVFHKCKDCEDVDPHASHACELKNQGCVAYLRAHQGQMWGSTAGIKPGVKGAKPAWFVEANEAKKGIFADAVGLTKRAAVSQETELAANLARVKELVENLARVSAADLPSDKAVDAEASESSTGTTNFPAGQLDDDLVAAAGKDNTTLTNPLTLRRQEAPAASAPGQISFQYIEMSNCPGHEDGVGSYFRKNTVITDNVDECQELCAQNHHCAAFVFCTEEDGCIDGGRGTMRKGTCLLKDRGCVTWLSSHRGESKGLISAVKHGHVEMHYDCFTSGMMYHPPMPGQETTNENSSEACQTRCVNTESCGHFTYFEDESCLLHAHGAEMTELPTAISGPRECDFAPLPAQ